MITRPHLSRLCTTGLIAFLVSLLLPAFATAAESEQGYLVKPTKVTYNDRWKKDVTFLMPSSEKLTHVWSDTPFIFCLPFEVTAAPGLPVSIIIDMEMTDIQNLGQYSTDYPPILDMRQLILEYHSYGILRPDNKPIPYGGKVFSLGDRYIRTVGDIVSLDGKPSPVMMSGMPVKRDKDLRLGIHDRSFGYIRILNSAAKAERFKHWGEKEKQGPVIIHLPADAPRGTYAFWMTLSPASFYPATGWAPPAVIPSSAKDVPELPKTLDLTILASMVEVRGSQEQIRRNRLDAVLGYDKLDPKDNYNLSDWRIMPDSQVPVSVQLNGWKLKTVVGKLSNKHPWPHREESAEWLKTTTGSIGPGTTTSASFKHDVYKRKIKAGPRKANGTIDWLPDGPFKILTTNSNTYSIEFPLAMHDTYAYDLKISGNHSAEPDKGYDPGWMFFFGGQTNLKTEKLPQMRTVWLNQGVDQTTFTKYYGETRAHHYNPPAFFPTYSNRGKIGARQTHLSYLAMPPKGSMMLGLEEHGQTTFPGAGLILNNWRDACVVGLYERMSESTSNEEGAPPSSDPVDSTIAEQTYDGFWEWYEPDFVSLSKKSTTELNAINGELTLIGVDIASLAKKQRILLAAYTSDSEYSNAAIKEGLRRQIADIGKEIARLRQSLPPKVEEGRQVCWTVIDAIKEQQARTKQADRQRPDLDLWLKKWEDRKKMLPAELYMAAGDINLFNGQVQWDVRTYSAQQHVTIGSMYQEAGEHIQAMGNFRAALRIDPDNSDAKRLLATIELQLLRAVARKTDGELMHARNECITYLRDRGFDVDSSGTFEQLFEDVWFSISTGPTAIMNVATGRVDTIESTSGTIQADAAISYAGVQGMIALVKRGVPLSEIAAGISSADMAKILNMKRTNADGYSASDYTNLGAAVKRALALPAIQALLSESPTEWQFAFEESEYDLDTVDMSEVRSRAIEDTLDIFSAKNTLFLLAPFSVGSVGGKLVGVKYWADSAKATAAIARAEAAGIQVMTGQEVITSAMGWGLIASRIGPTPTGQRILEMIAKSESFRTTGGIAWQASWGSSKIVAMVFYQWMISSTAAAYDKRLGLATDVLLQLFLDDPESILKVFQRSRLPKAKVASLIKDYAEEVQSLKKAVKQTEVGTLTRLERIALEKAADKAAKQGARQTASDSIAALDHHLQLEDLFNDWIPSGNLVVDQQFAFFKAVQSVHRGHKEEMRRATLAAFRLQKRLEDQLPEYERKVIDLHRVLQNLPADGLTKAPVPEFRRLRLLAKPTDEVLSEADQLVYRGDLMRMEGRYEEALNNYRAAALSHSVKGGKPLEATAILNRYQFTRDLRDAAAGYQRPPLKPEHQIPTNILEKASRKQADEAIPPLDADNMHSVFPVDVDGKKYALKRLVPFSDPEKQLTPEYLRKSLINEALAGDIAEIFGVQSPAITMRKVLDPDTGELKYFEMITEWQNGEALHKLGAPTAISAKDQMADSRVFAMLICDYDRKLDNYFFDPQTQRLVALDHGQAELISDLGEDDHLWRMQESLDHWLNRSRGGASNPNNKAWLHSQLLLEESLIKADFQPAIKRAQQLMKDPDAVAEIRRRMVAKMSQIEPDPAKIDEMADQAIKNMKERAELLDKINIEGVSTGGIRNRHPSHVNPDGAFITPSIRHEPPRVRPIIHLLPIRQEAA